MSSGNFRGESQSPWHWSLKCSMVLKHCIFPGHNLGCKLKKRKWRRKMTVVLLFVEIKQLFFSCQSVPDMSAYLQNGLNRLQRWVDKRLLCLPLPFHTFTSNIIWKRAFPPAALCSSQFSHKNLKETSKSVGYFPFNSKSDCLVVCLKCRAIQIVYSQRFRFMSPV